MKGLVLLFLTLLIVSGCKKEQIFIDDNFWVEEDPALHGFDVKALDSVLQNAANLPNFYALLVIRNQKLVAEEYYKGKNANDLFHLRSITKNFTSALSGIAIQEGLLDSADMPIKKYFPAFIHGDKEAITIRHLLNMASGLEWDENEEIIDLIEHKIPKPVEYLLAKDLSEQPATRFNYNSLSPHVVAHIITKETNQSLHAYAKEKLFDPLGIKRFEWQKDPQGADWGGFGLQLTARDLAKFGQLYLNGGVWEGQQVVPQEWVQESANQQIGISGTTSGYSFQWWISRGLGAPIYYGQGFGGQALMLVPEKNLMVVAFQEYFVMNDQHTQQWRNFVEKVFVPIINAAN